MQTDSTTRNAAETESARDEALGSVGALDASVESRLRAVAGRLRRYVLTEGVAAVVVFLVAAAAIQFLLDYGTRGLEWSMRAALSGAIALTAIYLVWRRVIMPLRHRFGFADIANLVERKHPELSSLLISAVQFSDGHIGPAASNSPDLVRSVIRQAGARAAAVDFGAVLDPSRSRRGVVMVTVSLALCVAAGVAAPDITRLWFYRNVLLQEIEWPKQTHLVVELIGGELIGARGDDLVIQAHAQGVQPREVDIVYETASGQTGRETMVTVGSSDAYGYRYTFKKAREDFTFHLVGGDDKTDTFTARLLERPHVTQTEMRIEPPAYTGLELLSLGDGERTARMLPGSELTLWINTNKPVVSAVLMANRETIAEAVKDDTRYRATCSPVESHTYHFALVDEVGLENRRPVRFSIRVTPDEPPRAGLKLVGVGNMITPAAILPIEVECSDTYGLATVDLIYRISRDGEEEEATIPLPSFTPSMTTLTTHVEWPVASEAMMPGERLTLSVRAADFNTVSGPGTSESAEISLNVVTRDELLAELARREQQYRIDFERLIDAQEQVRRGLLTVARRIGDADREETLGTSKLALPVELAPLERRQRNIAGSVNIIRQQFEQILSELRVNQLAGSTERERLGGGIVDPITSLAKRDLVTAADTLRQWARSSSDTDAREKASLIDSQQAAILSQMRKILANMIQWEGYQEVVSMLRDILRLQEELLAETRESLQEQGGDVFDD